MVKYYYIIIRKGGRLRGGRTSRCDCILHVIMSLLVCITTTTDDHLYNLQAKKLTLFNHALNGNFISGRRKLRSGIPSSFSCREGTTDTPWSTRENVEDSIANLVCLPVKQPEGILAVLNR